MMRVGGFGSFVLGLAILWPLAGVAEENSFVESAAVEGSLPAEPEPVPKTSGAEEEPAAMQVLSRVEEIVVTARRREELLEDTPIAVTAISAASRMAAASVS